MALDEDPDTPAGYWTSLAASQQAGTSKKCRCGESNPGDYDTCHFCQTPLTDDSPATPAPTVPGTAFTPTIDDTEGEYAGIPVASLNDGDDAIALTGQKDRALAAIDTYYRTVCGRPNLLDDPTRPLTDAYYYLDTGHAVFTRRADGGWQATPASPNAAHAVPVTWFDGTTGPVPDPYPPTPQPRLH